MIVFTEGLGCSSLNRINKFSSLFALIFPAVCQTGTFKVDTTIPSNHVGPYIVLPLVGSAVDNHIDVYTNMKGHFLKEKRLLYFSRDISSVIG